MMDELDEFKRLAVKLVVTHKLKHEELVSAIHAAISEETDKLPKIPVLYYNNDFDCSKQFADFEDGLTNKLQWDRIKDVAQIELFGKRCAEEYPIIEKLKR
jgi:hypothetical protein